MDHFTDALLVFLAILNFYMIYTVAPIKKWIERAESRLTKVETLLTIDQKRKDDSKRVHDELFSRVRKVELDIAKCHVCQGALPQDGG